MRWALFRQARSSTRQQGSEHVQSFGSKVAPTCLATQVVGRDSHDTSGTRLGLVEGKVFAPERRVWSRLSGVKRVRSHLFLR
jgi:hypothetical protein